ncbi:MAG: InlB B-repeat-containing protein [Lachnospiraceae bacterium]|jgi:uncharacterized repeat protein (TIGR02543 family)|nr:InlB B-repeat-containing protein [Lachnospiraceae bacterium]
MRKKLLASCLVVALMTGMVIPQLFADAGSTETGNETQEASQANIATAGNEEISETVQVIFLDGEREIFFDADGDEIISDNDEDTESDTTLSSEEIKAIKEEKALTLRLNIAKGTTLTLPAAPIKEGYHFEGWFTDEELSVPFDSSAIITEDTKLYAWFSQPDNGATVTDDAITTDESNAGSINGNESQEQTQDNTADLPIVDAFTTAPEETATYTPDDDAELVIEPITSGELYDLAVNALPDAEKIAVYDINLVKDGENIQPEGLMEVTIPFPEGFDPEKTSFYYIAPDGTTQEFYYTVDLANKTLTFETTHFSGYAITQHGSTPAKVQPKLTYTAHVQNYAWQSYIAANDSSKYAGTTGRSLRLEALSIRLFPGDYKGGIKVETHVQNIGWQSAADANIVTLDKLSGAYVSTDKFAGTTGKSLRAEAIKIKLTDELASNFDIFYRVHIQNIGWTPWTSNGEPAGTAAMSFRMEALELKLLPKGDTSAPKTALAYFGGSATVSYSVKANKATAFTGAVSNGATAGKEKSNVALEYLKVSPVTTMFTGNIEYSLHTQDVGWTSFKASGTELGTTNKRMEAVKIRLTGTLATFLDIYYRVYVPQWNGWTGWARNGDPVGSAGQSYRVEAIQIKLVTKSTAFSMGSNQYLNISAEKQALFNRIAKLGAGNTLAERYNWIKRNIRLGKASGGAGGRPTSNNGWQVKYASRLLDVRKGNCHMFAALMGMMAEQLGYKVEYHVGWCKAARGGLTGHGWVQINGLVYDPDLGKYLGNFCGVNRAATGMGYKDERIF